MADASRVNATLELAAGYAWRLIVVVAAAVLAGLVLAELRLVVLPVVAALVLCTFLLPPVRWLRRRGWRASLAAFAVLSVALSALGGLCAVLVPRVAGELRDLDFSLQRGIETVAAWVVEGPLGVSEADLERAIDRGLEQLRDNADTLLSGALTGAAAFVELVVGLLLTLVLLFFLLRDSETIGRWLVGLVAERHREAAREAGIRAWEILGRFIRGTTIIALFDATLIGIGLWALGIPLALPLAVLTFFGAYVPVAGAVVAGLAAALVALVAEGLVAALLVSALVLVVQQLESNVLQPVVLGRAVSLHPIAVALSITAGAVVGGIVGAILAVPTVAVAAAALPVLTRAGEAGR